MIYRLPPLNALRVFESAARHLSFKEAAAELHITQAAVSHQVKSLEEYLGIELFRREGRGVQLTEAARSSLHRLREGFDALAAAVETIRERGEETELAITAPPVFVARWLMPRLAEFSRIAPDIEVRVASSSKMVDAGALDSAALMSNLDLRIETSGVEIHLGAGDYPGFRADRLFSVSMALVASPDLTPPLREPADLASHVLLHDDALDLVAHGNAWEKWLEAAGVGDSVDGSRGPRFSTNMLSIEAASQKLGVALALRPLVDADLASGRLVEPFGIEVNPGSAYFLVCPEVIADRPAVAAFRAWLLKKAAESPLGELAAPRRPPAKPARPGKARSARRRAVASRSR
ncbi:MAG TPA: transcriptional regulator GcvA [Burkholderiales bacterium]|nr:transcriptional regulator GcvA [Burkholderiales bacterium]